MIPTQKRKYIESIKNIIKDADFVEDGWGNFKKFDYHIKINIGNIE